MCWSSYFIFTRDPLYQLYKQIAHYAFQRSSTNVEVCHLVMTIAPRTFANASFHFRARSLRQGHSRSFASRVRSLSLSVNLKLNYTRLRSQAVTQFVVILDASISAAVQYEATGNADNPLRLNLQRMQAFLISYGF